MDVSLDLLMNAVISGLLLGGFYAAVSIGVAISFGMLDIVNIAHPAFILLGSYIAFIANTVLGIDPILAAVIVLPDFYLLGMAVYQSTTWRSSTATSSCAACRSSSGRCWSPRWAHSGLRRRLSLGERPISAPVCTSSVRPAVRLLVPSSYGDGGRFTSVPVARPTRHQAVRHQLALQPMAANPVKIKRIALASRSPPRRWRVPV